VGRTFLSAALGVGVDFPPFEKKAAPPFRVRCERMGIPCGVWVRVRRTFLSAALDFPVRYRAAAFLAVAKFALFARQRIHAPKTPIARKKSTQ
jgi:hypothetical protein